jgi:lysophospholipase L1-like esterase
MTLTTKFCAAAALGLALGASACNNDELIRPPGFVPIDPLFARYVSMGNSITAGFQSAGILDSTQKQAYPVLLAQAMHSPFFAPLMNRPGCPAPYDSVFGAAGPHRISAIPCALRTVSPIPPPYISNVAVPGAEVIDGTSNLDTASNANGLTTFILGGQTQVQAMQRANPTFVTVWLGNNDVLGAVTTYGGDSTKITPTALFQTRYTAVLDAIDATPASGKGVLFGVANVTLIPFLSKGDTYFLIKAGTTSFPTNFVVAGNCAPDTLGGQGTNTLVPFPHGLGLVALARANPGNTYTLDCTAAQVVVPREKTLLINAVTAYNAFISAQATARGYAYIDPNTLFAALPPGAIPPFPNTTGANAVTRPFGDFFSRDGVHPNAASHKLVANALIAAINAKYATAIPVIP